MLDECGGNDEAEGSGGEAVSLEDKVNWILLLVVALFVIKGVELIGRILR